MLFGALELRGSFFVGIPCSEDDSTIIKAGLGAAYSLDRSIVYAEAALKNGVVKPDVVKNLTRLLSHIRSLLCMTLRTVLIRQTFIPLPSQVYGRMLAMIGLSPSRVVITVSALTEWMECLWDGVSYAMDGKKYDDPSYEQGGVNIPRSILDRFIF